MERGDYEVALRGGSMIVVFYSLTTGWHHQVSLLDKGETPRKSMPGEGVQVIDQATFDAWMLQRRIGGDRDPIQEYLNTFTGLTPQSCEYAVIENGTVVNVVGKADPALGHLDYEAATRPTAQILATPFRVAIGTTFDGQTFTNPVDPVIAKGVSLGS